MRTSWLVRCALSLLTVALLGSPAWALRYHVLPGGTRTSGASVPGDWTAANCYAELALAAAAAGPADSVLCSAGDHPVTAAVPLDAAFLGNQDLSHDPDAARLVLAATGQLAPPAGHPALRLQGLTVTGDGEVRAAPALAAAGLLLVVDGCRLVDLHLATTTNVGGAALRLTGGGTLTVSDSEFVGNQAVGRGGAIYLAEGHHAEFDRCLWQGNTSRASSDPRGGAIFVDARLALSDLVFRHCEFRDNVSGGPGGAVSLLSASATYEDCLVSGNRSGLDTGWSEGAGLHSRRNDGDHAGDTEAIVRRCTFTDNAGATDVELNGGDGGAFYTSGAPGPLYVRVVVEDSEFVGNYNLQGAGVYVSRWSDGVVRRCRFTDNIAYFMGGGVFKGGHFYENRGETLTVDQCLFVRNLAGFDAGGVPTGNYCRGGAVCVRMRPRIVARQCTFIDNRVSNSGYRFGDAFAHYFESGAWEPEMLCELQNCVFWGEGGAHVQVYSSPGGMAAADNLAAADGELNLGGLVPADPVVLTAIPFADDGGHPLRSGGLVDAGLELGFATDLDGLPMPQGTAPDIGCFELQPTTPTGELPLVASDLTATPNPFNPRTVLACRLERKRQVCSCSMARAAHLRTAALPAGVHQ
ncbi:MAG: right-handed parallel beta-helix repeat-containing protein [Candidatus Krumholzibacteriia bacterium]